MRLGYRTAVLAAFVCAGLLTATAAAAGTVLPSAARGAGPHPTGPNLIKFGGFESPVVASPCPGGGSSAATGVCTYSAGSTAIPDWTIGGDSVDLVSSAFWQPARGNQSLDLSGNAPGSVTQVVPTVPNRRYLLRWGMTGAPHCGPQS